MAIGPIAIVTMLTADLEKSQNMYSKAFNWKITNRDEIVTEIEARRWGSESLIGAKTVSVTGINGRVRFIEALDITKTQPLRTFGWTALEICVDDVFAYTDRAIAAGFELLNEPVALSGTGQPLPLIAAQLAGPNGEVVYITQILSEVPNFELPDVNTESGSIFICVLGASDLEKSRAVLESNFQLRRASDREVAIKVLNRVYGKDLATLHRLSSLQLNGRNAIEIDQLPILASTREKQAGQLVPGIAMVSVISNKEIAEVLVLPDGALLELLPADYQY